MVNLWYSLSLDIGIGAGIGLVTNYFAIKMLFHPFEKKWYFFNYQGLIPKEKDRIATKIGEIVENELIVPESFANKLKNGSMGNSILNFISSQIEEHIDNFSDRKPVEFIEPSLVDNIFLSIREKINEYLKSDVLKSHIHNEIDKYLRNIFKEKPVNLMSSSLIDGIKKVIINEIENFKNSNDIKPLIESQIDKLLYNIINSQKKLSDFPLLVEKIEDSEEKVIENILKYLVKMLKTNNKLRKYLFNHLPKIITDKFNEYKNEGFVKRLLGSFVSDEEIIDKIKDTINKEIDKLNSPAGFLKTKNNVLSFYRKDIKPSLLSTTISELISKVNVGSIDKIRDWISLTFIKAINKKAVSTYINNAIDKRVEIIVNETVEKNIEKISPKEQLLEELKIGLSDKIFNILEENKNEIFDKMEKYAKNYISNISIGDVTNTASQYLDLPRISNSVFEYGIEFISDNMKPLMEGLKISDIVCEEVKNFDLSKIEEIIYKISGEELRLITELGGVLGGIIGIVQFMKELYM